MALFGNNKKYKEGMKAGAAPFEKIFEDQSKQTKESTDAINANVDSIHSVVDVVLDDLVAQEKKRVYNLDTDYDILTLNQDEREFAIAMLYTLSQLMDETTEKQKQYLLNIQRYLNIRNPQVQIDVSSIENIENLKTQKMLYRIVTEYLFLAQENFEYADNLKYIFDYFSINKQSKNSIRGNIENIYKAVGADGLIEFYGYLSAEVKIDDKEPIAENTVDLKENDPAERFEEIEIAAEIVTIDSGGQDVSNDINSPELDFFYNVRGLHSKIKVNEFNSHIQECKPQSKFFDEVKTAFESLSKPEANNDDHQKNSRANIDSNH